MWKDSPSLGSVCLYLSLSFIHTDTISVSRHGSYAAYLQFKASFTYDLCLVSLVQCAAVNTCFAVIKEPPHQNSVRLDPCKKIAAIHGHFPGNASSPPTTRKFGFSGCPHSIILTMQYYYFHPMMMKPATIPGRSLNLPSESTIRVLLLRMSSDDEGIS